MLPSLGLGNIGEDELSTCLPRLRRGRTLLTALRVRDEFRVSRALLVSGVSTARVCKYGRFHLICQGIIYPTIWGLTIHPIRHLQISFAKVSAILCDGSAPLTYYADGIRSA